MQTTYAGPRFEPAAGWTSLQTGPVPVGSEDVPSAWTANIRFAQEESLSGRPTRTMSHLSPEGIVIWATFPWPALFPTPAGGRVFLDRTLPLSLADADVRLSWERQPVPNVPEYVIWARVNERYVDARAYFGVLAPSRHCLR